MFFKKKIKTNIEPFGEFEWDDGFWDGQTHYLGKKIQLAFDGTKESPEKTSVDNLKSQFNALDSSVRLAEEYIRSTSFSNFKKENIELKLSGLFLNNEIGEFNLIFVLIENDEDFIDVYFKDGKPYNVYIGDGIDDELELEEKDDSSIRSRSFLVTLGVVFIGVPVYVWVTEGYSITTYPVVATLIFMGLALMGLITLCLGLFGSKQKVKKWADGASSHEMSLVIMVLAYPVSLILSRFYEE